MLIQGGAGADGREAVWIGDAGDARRRGRPSSGRQVGLCAIGRKLPLRQVEHFHGIEPAPVFPVEAVGAAVRRRHDVHARLGRETGSLAARLDRGAVQREHESTTGSGLLPFSLGSAGTKE